MNNLLVLRDKIDKEDKIRERINTYIDKERIVKEDIDEEKKK